MISEKEFEGWIETATKSKVEFSDWFDDKKADPVKDLQLLKGEYKKTYGKLPTSLFLSKIFYQKLTELVSSNEWYMLVGRVIRESGEDGLIPFMGLELTICETSKRLIGVGINKLELYVEVK